MSPATTLGLALICAGTWLRVTCFRRLAKHFKFELSLQEDHRLIKEGPYAVVRHPSYSALLVAPGAARLHLGPRSLWYQRGFPGEAKWLGWAYVLVLAALFLRVSNRAKVEDDVLKAHFVEDGLEWAQKTPYRMIPWVY